MRWTTGLLAGSFLLLLGCGGWGGGSQWLQQPLGTEEERMPMPSGSSAGTRPARGSRTLGAPPAPREGERGERDKTGGGGRAVGTFRNTYYDFPRESEHTGEAVAIMNASCRSIATVPRGFYEALCVQGSGQLARGGTVSFAKRDCACAEVCPRTNQKICFEALDPRAFPWGRGASGRPITPLRSVAADPGVLAMGTVLYIPDFDGVPREGGEGVIDGCFVVEDRGLKVQGEHVDVFTGSQSQTLALNREVPSNRGVTVVVDAPKCAHLARAASASR